MKTKKVIAAAISILMIAALEINVFASILGELTGGYRVTMTDEAEFYHYSYNTSSAVQREYYVEYQPNTEVVPIVVNGDSIYGKRTITQAAQYMRDNGMTPMIGINADYFSFQTGIPMGHTIMDGELVTSDTTGQNAVGFNSDGTGFISWLEIQSKFITPDGNEMMIDCINKWCQPTISASYLLTDKFAASTKTSGNCKFIILSPVKGKLSIGDSIFLRVDEKFDYDGDIIIPEGKLVLVMTNTYGDPQKLQFMDSLEIGTEIELKTESVYDKELWSAAESGLGSVGGRLIENGTVYSQFEAGTAPRTAVGVRADGSLVFYVIDGRQTSVSTGVQIKTLAKRMSELGCVDAINLDGGGSTAIAGVFPGSDEFSVLNSPSDGGLRSCANYIFLKDTRVDVPRVHNISMDVSENRKYLSGYREALEVKSVTDENGNSVDTSAISYSVEQLEGNALELKENVVTVKGSGSGFVTLKLGQTTKHILYTVYATPQHIKVRKEGKELNSISVTKGKEYLIDLDASSFMYGSELHSDDSCYEWSCDAEIGYIDMNGVFVPDTNSVKSGSIYVRAGDTTLEVPVSVEPDSVFEDMENHWANEHANELYHMGIVTGEDKDGELVFRPDSNITRGEFAVIVARYMGLDVSAYDRYDFADYESIPDWQKPYANAAAAEGIITGKQTDGGVTFSGADSITRAEAMTILYRTTSKSFNYGDINFADSDKIPDYAKDAVNVLAGLGIVNGYNDGTLVPNGYVTRAESAKIVYGCIGVL